MDHLGRFYTLNLFSTLLVHEIKIEKPDSVIDIGIGDGSLTREAHLKWSNAKYIAIDIDKSRLIKISNDFPYVKSFHADALNIAFYKELKISVGSIDVAICNPPYLYVKNNPEYVSLLKEAGLASESESPSLVTSDLIFLAQNLMLLKEGGELGIILPDTLLTNKTYESFRKNLLLNHTLKLIIQLPENIFLKTEAKTSILIIKKGKSLSNLVDVKQADKYGNYTDSITLNKSSLIERMDFFYLKWKLKNTHFTGLKLKDIGVEIKRGSFSKKQLNNFNVPFLHLNNFSMSANIFNYERLTYSNFFLNSTRAMEGDIVLTRVGKRCIGKIGVIKSGEILVSDCILIIRVPKFYLSIVWNSITSEFGRDWINAHKHGVCSQIISKKDLLNFPLHI